MLRPWTSPRTSTSRSSSPIVADAITMARFRADDLEVTTKPDLTPVSEADQAVERAIRDRLAGVDRARGARRGVRTIPVARRDAEFRWIIDPIDGTKSYVRGVPIWATLIGLEHAGELVRRRRVGARAAHALVGRHAASARSATASRIHVSSVASLDDAQISFAWDTAERFDADGIGDADARRSSHRCWRTRGIGDFWQHMLVAEGAFDISIDPIVSLWDVAALVPIIEEAGGRWSTVDGRADADGGSFVCTNGRLHDDVLAARSQ